LRGVWGLVAKTPEESVQFVEFSLKTAMVYAVRDVLGKCSLDAPFFRKADNRSRTIDATRYARASAAAQIIANENQTLRQLNFGGRGDDILSRGN
jgi:hypothetical protein